MHYYETNGFKSNSSKLQLQLHNGQTFLMCVSAPSTPGFDPRVQSRLRFIKIEKRKIAIPRVIQPSWCSLEAHQRWILT